MKRGGPRLWMVWLPLFLGSAGYLAMKSTGQLLLLDLARLEARLTANTTAVSTRLRARPSPAVGSDAAEAAPPRQNDSSAQEEAARWNLIINLGISLPAVVVVGPLGGSLSEEYGRRLPIALPSACVCGRAESWVGLSRRPSPC